MVRPRRSGILAALRDRILRALQTGALHDGDRLPTSRELASEFRADSRVVAHAYRVLASEGLVEVRPRSGSFVASLPGGSGSRAEPPASWLAEVLAEGVLRGISIAALPRWLHSAADTRRLTAVVLATMYDQVEGLARELREDYGLEATGVLLDRLVPGEPLPRSVQRANLIVTTPANEARIRRLAERLHRPYVVACVRPDLMSVEWLSLLRRVAYVVVADTSFAAVVRNFLRGTADEENVRILIAGRDDLSQIPPDAPTYVTEAARVTLGRTRLPGRLVARTRVLAEDCVREIARVLVDVNLAAMKRRPRPRPRRHSR